MLNKNLTLLQQHDIIVRGDEMLFSVVNQLYYVVSHKPQYEINRFKEIFESKDFSRLNYLLYEYSAELEINLSVMGLYDVCDILKSEV